MGAVDTEIAGRKWFPFSWFKLMFESRSKPAVFAVATEDEMIELGQAIAVKLTKPCVMTLTGDLGTGKSVLARSIIRALGHNGPVKSPTYTLVETYELDSWRIAHLDLYRLTDPEELHYIAFDDIVANSDLVIIEWPDKGAGLLPETTLAVSIEYQPHGRSVIVTV